MVQSHDRKEMKEILKMHVKNMHNMEITDKEAEKKIEEV
jgi:hypothetical protein